jgi:hypothetical protein
MPLLRALRDVEFDGDAKDDGPLTSVGRVSPSRSAENRTVLAFESAGVFGFVTALEPEGVLAGAAAPAAALPAVFCSWGLASCPWNIALSSSSSCVDRLLRTPPPPGSL